MASQSKGSGSISKADDKDGNPWLRSAAGISRKRSSPNRDGLPRPKNKRILNYRLIGDKSRSVAVKQQSTTCHSVLNEENRTHRQPEQTPSTTLAHTSKTSGDSSQHGSTPGHKRTSDLDNSMNSGNDVLSSRKRQLHHDVQAEKKKHCYSTTRKSKSAARLRKLTESEIERGAQKQITNYFEITNSPRTCSQKNNHTRDSHLHSEFESTPSNLDTVSTKTIPLQTMANASVEEDDPGPSRLVTENSVSDSGTRTVRSSASDKPKRRRVRCRKCESCRTPDCGECSNCRDKRPGGPKKKHQACKNKPQCLQWSKPQDNACSDESDDHEYRDALTHGYVIIKTTKCTFFGPPGSGKSTVLSLILDPTSKPVPRHSTPVAEKAVQATTWAKLISTNQNDPLGTWVIFDSEQMVDVVSNSVKMKHYERDHSSEAMSSLSEATLGSDKLSQRSKLTESTSSMSKTDKKSARSRLKHKLDLLKASRGKSSHVSFKEINLIYLVDTGGQPQFQEIVPLFVRNASVNALVFKLSEKFKDYPENAYWIHGREFSEPKDLRLTNEELILYAAHSIYSGTMHRKISAAVESPDHPSVLLVGTFADQEHKDESKEQKQAFLKKKSSLKKYMDLDWLITLSRGNYIVDVDGSKKWHGKQEEAETLDNLKKLRSAILTQSQKLKVKVPLSWFFFLDDLQNEAKERKFLSLEECCEIGKQLEMSEKNVQAALEFLDELNIILYYPEYLPNVVFCEPQFLLRKVTEIIVASFPLAAPDVDHDLTGTREKFRDQGIFNSKILEHEEFKQGFNTGFTTENLLTLLQGLLIIAEVGKGTYFMPCVLPYEDPKCVSNHYDTTIEPLWIYFMQDHTPVAYFVLPLST